MGKIKTWEKKIWQFVSKIEEKLYSVDKIKDKYIE